MTVIIPVRYRMSLSINLVPQLQLWHLHLLCSAQAVGGLTSEVIKVLRIMSHEDAAPISILWLPNNIDQDNVACIPVHQ